MRRPCQQSKEKPHGPPPSVVLARLFVGYLPCLAIPPLMIGLAGFFERAIQTVWSAAAIAMVVAAMAPVMASAQSCLLCAPPPPGQSMDQRGTSPATALRIEITGQLDFSRVATSPSGGAIVLDPASGARRLSGGLVDLGGFSLIGQAEVRGEPGRNIRIILPHEIIMEGSGGQTARATALVTDIGPVARLGGDGVLRFRFGAQLQVRSDADGNYRGRIPISVEYE